MDARGRKREFAWVERAAGELVGVSVEHRDAWDGTILWVGSPHRRKMFAFCCDTLGGGASGPFDPVVTLKCPPELNIALTDGHGWITPGWHFNKRHWISLHTRHREFSKDLAQDLLALAWETTVLALPRSARPIDNLENGGNGVHHESVPDER